MSITVKDCFCSSLSYEATGKHTNTKYIHHPHLHIVYNMFFSLTLPLIQGQCGVVMAVIIHLGLTKVIRVPQTVEVWVLQSQFCCGPLVPIEDQHLLQQVDTCK